jgi:uncharacterized membrane protein YbhN (UPF0104 family)
VLLLVGAALWALRGELPTIAATVRSLYPRWGLLALASAIVLATYALLIETWRRVLGALGSPLGWTTAALIWLGSNLARYLPGTLWQLGVMSMMTRRRGIGLANAGTSALLIAIVNVYTGIAVWAVFSARAPALAGKGIWFVALGGLALAAATFGMPFAARAFGRITGRRIELPRVDARSIVLATIGTSLAWLAYGLAFWALSKAILPDGPRSLDAAIAIYTASYLAGFLAILPPAGLGVAEGVMVALGLEMGYASRVELITLALVVRLWRTLLEIVPGIVAVAFETRASHAALPAESQPSRGNRMP